MKTADLSRAAVLNSSRNLLKTGIAKIQERLARPFGELIRKGEYADSVHYVKLSENVERMVLTLALGDGMQQLSVIKAELLALGIED